MKSLYRLLPLLSHQQFTSGQTLADELQVTRPTVSNWVAELVAQGVDVYSVKGRGYRLAEPVSLLDRERILDVYEEKVRYPFPPDSHPIFMGQELSIVKISYDPKAMTVPQDDEFDELLWIEPGEIVKYNSEYRAEAYFRAMEICQLI